MYINSSGYSIQSLEILFASTYAGYMDDASTADTYLSNPGLKHITSPPTLVRSS